MLGEETLVPAAAPPSWRALQQRLFTLLEKCDTASKASQIHAHLITANLSHKRFLLTKLISLYTSFALPNLARQTFSRLPSPTTPAWNQMIRLTSSNHQSSPESVHLLNVMRNRGCSPDGYSYSYALNGFVRFGMVREGRMIHGRVVSHGFVSNVVIGTSLVNLYGSAGFLGCARKVFDEMPERNVVTWNSLLAGYFRRGDVDGGVRVFDEMPERSVVSWTIMVSGCARHGQCRRALALFNEMRRACVELDEVALVAVLSACAELGDLNLGKWIHSYVGGKRSLLVSLQNALIHMYASCGVLEEACGVFEEIPCKSVVSWTSMILGYAKHGRGEEALSLFKVMEAEQVRPADITFIGVLSACSHAGLVEEGRTYFKEMTEKWGIEPSIEHYGCMVDLLSRAGFLDEAQGLIESMPMEPNNAIWGALLGGCRIHKNIKIASHAAHNLMLEHDPEEAMGYLLLLSDIYAMGRRWEDVAAIREKLIRVGASKPSGRSWIQVKGIMHDFAAGDWNHKDAFSIYEILDNISCQMMNDVCENEHKIDEDDVDVKNMILSCR